MQSVQKIKKELQLNKELTEFLGVLKGIAASEFHILERKKERFAKFTESFEKFFRMIDFSSVEHPFAQDRAGRLGIIMITSDEGFMGGLNTQVMNTALSHPGADKAELIIIGERGVGYLRGLGRKFISFPGITSKKRYEAALGLKDYIIKGALTGEFGRLILAYPKPISFTAQKIEILKILPSSELFEKRERIVEKAEDIILESSLNGIIEYLVETWITAKLFEVFEDSKLAEFSARTLHLEESHQVLLQQGKTIRFQYFRSRHELIDKGMRETFSAQIIRKRKIVRS